MSSELDKILDLIDIAAAFEDSSETSAKMQGREFIRRYIIKSDMSVVKMPDLSLTELMDRFPGHKVITVPSSMIEGGGLTCSLLRYWVKQFEWQIWESRSRDVSHIIFSKESYRKMVKLRNK